LQQSKDSGCRLDNEPGSREFPHFIRGQEGQAWMTFTIRLFLSEKSVPE
jgi:hypothetical protein